jgi:hypothetical protein
MTKCSPARNLAAALSCIIWLLLAAGCATPVGVERVDATTAQHDLTANALTADEPSPSARNVLRRWVLSERCDDDPAGAIATLYTIATDGRGDEDEVIALAENVLPLSREDASAAVLPWRCSLQLCDSRERVAAAEPCDPRLRLAADLYNLGIIVP